MPAPHLCVVPSYLPVGGSHHLADSIPCSFIFFLLFLLLIPIVSFPVLFRAPAEVPPLLSSHGHSCDCQPARGSQWCGFSCELGDSQTLLSRVEALDYAYTARPFLPLLSDLWGSNVSHQSCGASRFDPSQGVLRIFLIRPPCGLLAWPLATCMCQ